MNLFKKETEVIEYVPNKEEYLAFLTYLDQRNKNLVELHSGEPYLKNEPVWSRYTNEQINYRIALNCPSCNSSKIKPHYYSYRELRGSYTVDYKEYYFYICNTCNLKMLTSGETRWSRGEYTEVWRDS